MWAFVEYAARVRPQVAIFESVRAAYSQGHSLMLGLRARLEQLTGDQWTLIHVKHDAYALGGPAIRRRYFWVASRVPFGVEHPVLPHLPTLDDAIGDLETLGLTWERQGYRSPPTPWSATRRSTTNLVDGHATPESSTPAGKRILDLARLGVWDQGDSMSDAARRSWNEFGSLPPSWNNVPKHVASDFNFGYCSTGRWKANSHARVITGGGPYCTVHPRLDRLITHREIARIMGFPDDWLIEPLRGTRGLASTWGKGITVDAGRWIATWARESILGTPGELQGELVGDREYEITVTKPRVQEHDTTDILAFLSHRLKEEHQDGREHHNAAWQATLR
jgi:site-specific DNA-cytosine methylase